MPEDAEVYSKLSIDFQNEGKVEGKKARVKGAEIKNENLGERS